MPVLLVITLINVWSNLGEREDLACITGINEERGASFSEMYSCVFQGLYQLKTHKRGDSNFIWEILHDQNDQMTRSTVLKITGCMAIFMRMSSKDKLWVLLFTFFHTTPFNPCLSSRSHYHLELLRVLNTLIHPLDRVEVEMVHEFYSYGLF